MNRKHFNEMARQFKACRPLTEDSSAYVVWTQCVEGFIHVALQMNGEFSPSGFREACR